MLRSAGRSWLGAIVALVAVLATPALAQAAKPTQWVAPGAANAGPGTSCAEPGYSTIQAAIGAAGNGATIQVCPGTYSEQLSITKPLKLQAADGQYTATIALPATPVNSSTECDAAAGKTVYGTPQDEISICTSGVVSLTGLTVVAKWPAGTCNENLYGILVAGGATLKAKQVTMQGAGASPINGCQGGVGIQVGMAWTTPVEVGHATLSYDDVSEYQKNGITVDGAGSSAKIVRATVVGAGETTQTAQNGIQISNGAQGTIKGSTIERNECRAASCGPDAWSETQATGVLFYGAASGSSLTSSHLFGNDDNVYFESQSPTQPSSSEVTIVRDRMGADYEAVVLGQGDASIDKDLMAGSSKIGILVLQDEGQAYAPSSTATSDIVTDQSEAAVKVDSDNAPGDHAGNLTLTKTYLGGYPPAEVLDESTTFTVTQVEPLTEA
jgi:hypothetical protein